jgi:hypothetical protein
VTAQAPFRWRRSKGRIAGRAFGRWCGGTSRWREAWSRRLLDGEVDTVRSKRWMFRC